jgi:hypothetical protein
MAHTVFIINFNLLTKDGRSSAASFCVSRTGRDVTTAYLSISIRCFRVPLSRKSRRFWQHTCPTSENFIKCGGPMVTEWTSTIDSHGPASSAPSVVVLALSIRLLYAAVGTAIRLRARRPRRRGSITVRGKTFSFSITSRLILGPTQPPIQWIPGAISRR